MNDFNSKDENLDLILDSSKVKREKRKEKKDIDD